MRTVNRWRRWASRRGFSHVSQTLEAAAVMAWFAACVIGERYLADATHARRGAEVSAQQSSIQTATNYCQDGGTGTGQSGVTSSIQMFQNGKPSISNILSMIMAVGLGSQNTFANYTDPFQGANAKALSSIGAGLSPGATASSQPSRQFRAERSLACLERSKDSPASPEMSIKQYQERISLFNFIPQYL